MISAIPHLVALAGAAAAILVTGAQDVWSLCLLLVGGGLALFILRPVVQPRGVPSLLLAAFCLLCLLAFLPQQYFPEPAWRGGLDSLDTVLLAKSVSPQPWLGWFWWWFVVASCLLAWGLLTAPLESKALAAVLHAAALFAAVYALLAVFDAQSVWHYPFHGGAVFGFLPNRNHSATLLVVGSILSLGLMQWRLARGEKGMAVLAALCGAPSVAALLFFSVSRAGVLLLAVAVVVWVAGAPRSPAARAKLLATVCMLGICLGLLFLAGGSTVRERLGSLFAETADLASAGDVGGDVDFRQPIYRDTVRMIGDFPWTGAGLGQFFDVFPQYRKDSSRATNVLHPESDWLMVAAESGLPAALVLAGVAIWYLVACWKSRNAAGGMLRWTAASAVMAALLHGVIDVPWHRLPLGWFLMVLAASSVPSSQQVLRSRRILRLAFVGGGVAFVAGAMWLGWEKSKGRSPGFYRLPEISRQLEELGNRGLFEEAEAVAREAVQRFPMRWETYYWLAGYLCMFTETDDEVRALVRAGRAVEPGLPAIPADQAVILEAIGKEDALDSWLLAVDRAVAIDMGQGRDQLPTAGIYIGRAIASYADKTDQQIALGRRLSRHPLLLGYWLGQVSNKAAAPLVADIKDPKNFLHALPEKVRRQVLARWMASADSGRAVLYMEVQEAASQDAGYWPPLARYYAGQGNLQKAVQRVASSLQIELAGPGEGEAGLRGRIAALEAGGNTVAALRVANEAITADEAGQDDLAASMAYFASREEWQSAWKAASRLATEAKIGQ